MFSEGTKNWSSSRDYCQGLGAALVRVDTESELVMIGGVTQNADNGDGSRLVSCVGAGALMWITRVRRASSKGLKDRQTIGLAYPVSRRTSPGDGPAETYLTAGKRESL